jgi:hypothetical protein
MPFLEQGFHQARRDRLFDDNSFVVYRIDEDGDRLPDRVLSGLKEWQANAIARILTGERPGGWHRRKDERKQVKAAEK